MQNPWEKLTDKPPYILSEDREVLERRNKDKNFVFDLLPEPFLGSVKKAKIILLNLNPGFHDEDHIAHARIDFARALRKNLLQKQQKYGFYLLNPEFSNTPGYAWWNRKLRELIEQCGRIMVSQKVACIEFFPYHSLKWKGLGMPVPSQQYAVHLVRQAIKEKKIILLMRAKREWFNCVPELEAYPFLLKLNSPQNVSVSRKNVGDQKFYNMTRAILEA